MSVPEYRVEVTLHETGQVVVKANNAEEAMRGIREGRIEWECFDQTEIPRIGVRRAWREPAQES